MGHNKIAHGNTHKGKIAPKFYGPPTPLVIPHVAVRWKKSNSPPYTRGKNHIWGPDILKIAHGNAHQGKIAPKF